MEQRVCCVLRDGWLEVTKGRQRTKSDQLIFQIFLAPASPRFGTKGRAAKNRKLDEETAVSYRAAHGRETSRQACPAKNAGARRTASASAICRVFARNCREGATDCLGRRLHPGHAVMARGCLWKESRISTSVAVAFTDDWHCGERHPSFSCLNAVAVFARPPGLKETRAAWSIFTKWTEGNFLP